MRSLVTMGTIFLVKEMSYVNARLVKGITIRCLYSYHMFEHNTA